MEKFFFCILFCVGSIANGQVPSWQWAASPAGTGEAETHAVAADASGNIYSTGWYYGTALTFGSTTLNFSGDGDIYLVKYDSAGNVLWAWSAGGSGFDEPRSIAVDGNGNVYVTGVFDSPSLTIGSTTLINDDSTTIDVFLAKFDSSGNVLWARREGGTDREFAESVSTDYTGNVYVTGSFEGATLTLDAVVLTNAFPASEDIYVVKYDPAGNVLWAKSGNGTNLDWATCVTTDPYGNVFIAGPYYSDTLVFDGTAIVNPFSSFGYEEIFMVKYDSSGTLLWAKGIAGNNFFNEAYSLASDAFGNIFIAGTITSDTIIFDTYILGDEGVGYYDMVLAKYDLSGNFLWAKKAGGYGIDYAYAVAVDASGNAYVAGHFDNDTLYFDSLHYLLVNQDYYNDMFLVKYDGSGNVIWAKATGGIYQPLSYGFPQMGIACDGDQGVLVAGCIQFDSLSFDTDTLFLNGNNTNVFVAKLYDAGSCAATFGLYPDSSTQHHYWALNQASGVAPLTYLWSWGDGSFDTTPYPSHTYATGGFYPICLTITDSTGCTNTVCHTSQLQRMSYTNESNTMVYVNVVASLPVSIDDKNNGSEFLIYPNPANSSFTILSTENLSNSVIEICNLPGEKIYSSVLEHCDGSLTVDCKPFPSGIYFVSRQTEKGMSVRKLIIQ